VPRSLLGSPRYRRARSRAQAISASACRSIVHSSLSTPTTTPRSRTVLGVRQLGLSKPPPNGGGFHRDSRANGPSGQPGLAAPQSCIAATKKSVPEARRAQENSPGREPWVRIANLPAPARGERCTRLQFFRPVPGLACLSRRSQCSRTGLVSDAPSGLGLRQNRRTLRRI
jgi:hypothetical protein